MQRAVARSLNGGFTACLVFFALSVSLAQAAPSTPTTDFTDNGDGTVTHKTTGLTWKRCAEGMTWSGSTCTGTAATYTWVQATALTATFAGKSDWRLPTIAELVTIVESNNDKPAINLTVFPNTTASDFWSASAFAGDSSSAWFVSFNHGYDFPCHRTLNDQARLVRGGQLLGSSGLYTPTSDFTDNGNGTVTHKKTSLTWKRCAEGQTWTGSTCTGTAASYTWADATALTQSYAGYTDWRLPTLNELQTLVEYSIAYPGATINSAIFPSTPASSYFWSASAYAGDSSGAWLVFFYDGDGYTYGRTGNYRARLVRGGQSVGTSSTPADCLFDWAEKTYPQLFSPAGGTSQTLDVYYYRQYVGNTYLGISSKDNHVYYLTGGNMGDAGLASQWYGQAGCK